MYLKKSQTIADTCDMSISFLFENLKVGGSNPLATGKYHKIK